MKIKTWFAELTITHLLTLIGVGAAVGLVAVGVFITVHLLR